MVEARKSWEQFRNSESGRVTKVSEVDLKLFACNPNLITSVEKRDFIAQLEKANNEIKELLVQYRLAAKEDLKNSMRDRLEAEIFDTRSRKFK